MNKIEAILSPLNKIILINEINDKKIKRLGWKENKNFKIEIKKLLEKKSILR